MALSPDYIRKINEMLVWSNHHAGMIGAQPVERQVEFLLKGYNNMLDLLRELSVEADRIDDGSRLARNAPSIILPKSVLWRVK